MVVGNGLAHLHLGVARIPGVAVDRPVPGLDVTQDLLHLLWRLDHKRPEEDQCGQYEDTRSVVQDAPQLAPDGRRLDGEHLRLGQGVTALLEGISDRFDGGVQFARLLQVGAGVQLAGLLGRIDGPLSGEDDDLHLLVDRPDFPKHNLSAHPGHGQVKHYHIWAVKAYRPDGFLAIGCLGDIKLPPG